MFGNSIGKNGRKVIMKTTKINIELALSRNFDKVSLGMIDEPIEHETEEGFISAVRQRFKLLRGEITREFSNIQ
jgi:hypothetical protein